VPVVKQAGAGVHSGTCNLDGDLVVEVTAAPGAGTLERLIDAVSAAASGSRHARLAERVAAWFLPAVLSCAAVTTLLHARWFGPAAGVLAGLAVVVVSCPCALGLATPMALWAAIGQATRRHVLVRDGDAFVRLALADRFCFDKTGTLTTGCRVVAIGQPDDEAPDFGGATDHPLAIAAALAAGSTHVHAAAIASVAEGLGVVVAPVHGIRTVAGCGVEGRTATGPGNDPWPDAGGRDPPLVRLGSPRWASADPGTPRPRGWRRLPGSAGEPPDGEPQCVLTGSGRVRLGFWLAEEVRPQAAATLAALQAGGRGVLVLSGDRPDRVAAVAAPLGVAWRAPLLPSDKHAAVESFSASGQTVVMVGDGINDAPALAAADVGVALGCGADVSRWSADICLLQDDLAALPWLVDLARRTRRTIRWNLLWAFGYNAACVPLAAAGLVHPAVAAVAMVVSSLLVIGNSLRLGGDEPAAVAAPSGGVVSCEVAA